MLIQSIRFVFILVGAVGGYQLANEFGWPDLILNKNLAIIIYMILGSATGYVFGGIIGRRLLRFLNWIEDSLQNVPIAELIIGVAGLVTGLVLAFLITLPFSLIEIAALKIFLTGFTYVVFAWLGVRLSTGRRGELKETLNFNGVATTISSIGQRQANDKLFDTNIIIDGRIIDIARTGFLEGKLIVPRFVLHELQSVADSKDPLKRSRGRRGLDILNSLQSDIGLKIEIGEVDFPQIIGVDAKLVQLARETGAIIITNDYNLNKVAQLEGVKVLNLNDLANAVKAVVLPGEELAIKIVREGKEPGQGVGYLEDGTMVVVEGGLGHLGQNVNLKVTSVLQTPAGRMIFTKIKAAANL